ncbi:hypothetical protein [Bradyrhizobium sp. USDA 4529]
MAFAIKIEIRNPRAKVFTFTAQKTMYGGKHIAADDVVFVFASENEGGSGLIAITVRRTACAARLLGRDQLKRFKDWGDGRPETELNFKFYRQATNKIVGISDETAALLERFF